MHARRSTAGALKFATLMALDYRTVHAISATVSLQTLHRARQLITVPPTMGDAVKCALMTARDCRIALVI